MRGIADHEADSLLVHSGQIIYDKASGDLLFDAEGAGGAAAVKFAAVNPGISLTADDFIVF